MCPLHAGCSVQALTGWSGSRSTWRRTHVRADRPASPLCDPRICSRAPLPAPCVGRRGLWRTPPPPRAISPLAEATVAVSLSARFALVSRSVYRSVCLFFSLFPSPLPCRRGGEDHAHVGGALLVQGDDGALTTEQPSHRAALWRPGKSPSSKKRSSKKTPPPLCHLFSLSLMDHPLSEPL